MGKSQLPSGQPYIRYRSPEGKMYRSLKQVQRELGGELSRTSCQGDLNGSGAVPKLRDFAGRIKRKLRNVQKKDSSIVGTRPCAESAASSAITQTAQSGSAADAETALLTPPKRSRMKEAKPVTTDDVPQVHMEAVFDLDRFALGAARSSCTVGEARPAASQYPQGPDKNANASTDTAEALEQGKARSAADQSPQRLDRKTSVVKDRQASVGTFVQHHFTVSKGPAGASAHRGEAAVVLDSDSEPEDEDNDDKPLIQSFPRPHQQQQQQPPITTNNTSNRQPSTANRQPSMTTITTTSKNDTNRPHGEQEQVPKVQAPPTAKASEAGNSSTNLQCTHAGSGEGFISALERLNVLAFDRPQRKMSRELFGHS